ncbi:MAG: putative nicotinate-nucleotide pyrophosphorylase [carboxylating] [Ignavibacteriaceae bacterium]|nr:putative nicotinate-nucleotide pyrophosphorylase [carboxylating] [Ignavibacteriaceae bacterium]MCK6615098.1 carboxylating nicotinate-nucleotide diphosphorylase [Ignavibacteriaceae bacterium]
MNNDIFYHPSIDHLITLAIKEDLDTGDITGEAIFSNEAATGRFVVKQDGVISGLPMIEIVYKKLHLQSSVECFFKDGDHVKKGDIVAEMHGEAKKLLTGERTVLNFLQRMSGIATKASRFIGEMKEYKTKLLDTRKTLPGHRLLDKYAVTCGGASNHRMGLYDMFLIKDNHIAVAGSVTRAINNCRDYAVRQNLNVKLEVEVDTLAQFSEALALKPDIIMLDNFSLEDISKAVDMNRGTCLLEVSGGVRLEDVHSIAALGVDYISTGSLTHSVEALDISLDVELG